MKSIEYSIISLLLLINLAGCTLENCRIDFEKNSIKYEQAVAEILESGLKMDRSEEHYNLLKTIREKDVGSSSGLFHEIEFIEIHEDSTIIFQAPNCRKGSVLRDVIYVLAYSPKGVEHVKGKRNLSGLKEVAVDWYYGKHINTLAN